MMRAKRAGIVLGAAGALLLLGGGFMAAGEAQPEKNTPKWTVAVKPKPLSENVKKGLDWLAKHQLESGAWNQGEESQQMGGTTLDKPSVADTCVAALALLRSGSTPKDGDYAKNLRKALDFVCSEVEKSKENTLFVTDVRGTRVQSKIGQYVDTFMSCLLLSEAKGKMPDQKTEARLDEALKKVVRKMSENQREDGGWGDKGWAAGVGQSYGVRGLNRAAQNGVAVPKEALARVEKRANESFDAGKKDFKGGEDAGVKLYSGAAALGGLQDADNTNGIRERQAQAVLANSKDDKERAQAEQTIKSVAATRKQLEAAQGVMIAKLDDKGFVAGFGSNGGEEFLSYLSIGESLVVKGGDAWEKWDKSMTDNMNKIQNKDGSWTGHHCITGRTFCTSTALMVLMVDRTPVPVAAEMKRR